MNDFTQTIDDLATRGWSVTPDFLPVGATARLAGEIRQHFAEGDMRQAGVSMERQVNISIRNDLILWLNEGELTTVQQVYFDALEQLRLAVNAKLQLGLFEFECHAAVYPPGSFYRKHLDNFQHSNQRVLTCILYLNQDWQDADGGQLRMYLDSGSTDISPTAGTLVAFLSSRYWHEVLPARRERLSMTGWFKQRDHT